MADVDIQSYGNASAAEQALIERLTLELTPAIHAAIERIAVRERLTCDKVISLATSSTLSVIGQCVAIALKLSRDEQLEFMQRTGHDMARELRRVTDRRFNTGPNRTGGVG